MLLLASFGLYHVKAEAVVIERQGIEKSFAYRVSTKPDKSRRNLNAHVVSFSGDDRYFTEGKGNFASQDDDDDDDGEGNKKGKGKNKKSHKSSKSSKNDHGDRKPSAKPVPKPTLVHTPKPNPKPNPKPTIVPTPASGTGQSQDNMRKFP